ncbi:addiction module RelE/StbE family toxin [Aquamicrobium terrae]
MKRAVQWSRDALNDLKDQVAFIATDNPAAARRIADRIRHAGKSLGDMATGRPGRVVSTYEKPVLGLPYIIAYAIVSAAAGEAIVILRVIHMSRDWPPGEWPD